MVYSQDEKIRIDSKKHLETVLTRTSLSTQTWKNAFLTCVNTSQPKVLLMVFLASLRYVSNPVMTI